MIKLPLARSSFVPAGALGALLVALVGCGGGTEGTDVSGTVTFNGAPVPQGTIAFLKPGAPAAGGPIGADGSYKLTLPAGEYQVRIDAMANRPEGWKESDPPPARLVPEKYANFDTSGLTAKVGSDTAGPIDFKLP